MMNDLLNNPGFQSALLPLLVALIVGFALRPLGNTWAGLGFAVAYGASVYVTVGFQFTPLTSTRKIFLLAVVAVVLGVLLDLYRGSRKPIAWVVALLGVGAVSWVIWPLLTRTTGKEFWVMLLATSLYSAWIIGWFEGLRSDAMRASTTALSIGVGTGVSAVFGASALLGQLGGAIGAAAGAFVLLSLFKKHDSLGSSFTLPVALLSALIGVNAVVYAEMAWYVLFPLIFIPLAARLPVKKDWNRFIKVVVLSSYTLVLAGMAIWGSWQIAQSVEPSIYY